MSAAELLGDVHDHELRLFRPGIVGVVFDFAALGAFLALLPIFDILLPLSARVGLDLVKGCRGGFDCGGFARSLGHDDRVPEARPLEPGPVVALDLEDGIPADAAGDAGGRWGREHVVGDAHDRGLADHPVPQGRGQELDREQGRGWRRAELAGVGPVVRFGLLPLRLAVRGTAIAGRARSAAVAVAARGGGAGPVLARHALVRASFGRLEVGCLGHGGGPLSR